MIISFEIGMNRNDKPLLEAIMRELAFGSLHFNKQDYTYIYKIIKIHDISYVLIPSLYKYPLTTQKRADYELFAKIVNRISEQRHLILDGLQEIVNLKASMNIGLSDRLKKYFSNVIPYPRPQVASDKIQDPQ